MEKFNCSRLAPTPHRQHHSAIQHFLDGSQKRRLTHELKPATEIFYIDAHDESENPMPNN